MTAKCGCMLVHVIDGLIYWVGYFVQDSDHRQVFE